MQKRILAILTIVLVMMFIFSSCSKKISQSSTPKEANKIKTSTMTGPPVIIYKTKKDYYHNVPVTLSQDKRIIVNYPDIKDVFYNGQLALPTRLSKGYLLDNRGINQNVAFLRYTYEEYSRLPETPSAEELFKTIIDTDPLMEIYSAGTRFQYKHLEEEMNKVIDDGKFDQFKKMK